MYRDMGRRMIGSSIILAEKKANKIKLCVGKIGR